MELAKLPAWQALQEHAREMADVHMRELFAADPRRYQTFSLQHEQLLLDYSRNRVDARTRTLLLELAAQRGVLEAAARMVAGEHLNTSEDRAALHTLLRAPRDNGVTLEGVAVWPQVQAALGRMEAFCQRLRERRWPGAGGEPVTDVVNLGIGGSHLGPEMVTRALGELATGQPRVHFVSNVDGADLAGKLAQLEPSTTLFIVSSKSFSTMETMTNADSALGWLCDAGIEKDTALRRHFVAVSANREAVAAFGIHEDNRFPLWDWVGGRYSLWSCVGLPIALAVGMSAFRELLAGAAEMDRHFLEAPPGQNMPLMMGLLGVWYVNFFGCQSHAVLPYDRRLALLPTHLQQADMESNGKRVDRHGRRMAVATGPLVWGGEGTSGQHAFFQWLHQGAQWVPVDFVGCATPEHSLTHHHRVLLANLLAQPRALMRGRTVDEARVLLRERGVDADTARRLLPHLVFPGNRPSNTLLLRRLDPRTLGALLALYEHKIFVQGWIWNVNSFDQWGVELGKEMAVEALAALNDERAAQGDQSEHELLDWCRRNGFD